MLSKTDPRGKLCSSLNPKFSAWCGIVAWGMRDIRFTFGEDQKANRASHSPQRTHTVCHMFDALSSVKKTSV